MRSRDTTAAAEAVQNSIYRRLAPSERFAIAVSMSEDMKAVSAAGAESRCTTAEGAPVRP